VRWRRCYSAGPSPPRPAGRTGARTISSLRALTAGFGLVTLGALLGGLLHWTGVVSLIRGQAVQSLLTGAGLAVIVHSLLLDDHRDRSHKDEGPFKRTD
jgi:hypothetical protein